MEILHKYSLKKLNTFGVDVSAKIFVDVTNVNLLRQIILNPELKKEKLLVLGGGSNILFTEDFDGLVVKMSISGKEVIAEDENSVLLKVAGGEDWEELVDYCVDNNWGGIENLSLIPGQAGTAPVQNIGAYGIEAKDIIQEVHTVSIENGEERIFQNNDCNFSYRNSVFKNELKGKYIITAIVLKLTKPGYHKLNLDYGAITQKLNDLGIAEPTIKEISDVIKDIRRSKLPDHKTLGNAGSFFKNPVIGESQLNGIIEKYSDLRYFDLGNRSYKLAAGWLIDNLKLKGFRMGDAAVHEDQALVLVNHGNATGSDIVQLSKEVQKRVAEAYGVAIEAEVNII